MRDISRPSGLSRLFAAALGLWLLAAAAPALADPPLRVGRVSALFGPVSYHPANDGTWAPAMVNYPVTAGDAFWTEPNARAEFGFGEAVARLDHASELEILALDVHQLRLQLPQGTLSLRLRRLDPGTAYQVATPRGTAILTAPGAYDIVAGSADAPTLVSVLHGTATFDAAGAQLDLRAGEAVRIAGGAHPSYEIIEAAPSAFDDWSLARDRAEQASAALHYVSPAMPGYDDLDHYGTWQPATAYGTVWYPNAVPADWAPYRYGRWVFVAPWGWTWVDDTPWGFAPFHYGRWVLLGGRWGWVPGAYAPQPVYAPALVAFLGTPNFGGAFGVGSIHAIAWIPLGPNEVYHPFYPCTPRYLRSINIANVRNPATITARPRGAVALANMHYANRPAMTAVSLATFSAAHPIGRAMVRVPAATLDHQPLAMVTPPAPARNAPRGPAAAAPPRPGLRIAPQAGTFHPASHPPQPTVMRGAGPGPNHATPQAAPAHPAVAPNHRPPAAAYAARPEASPHPAISHPTQHAPLVETPQGWRRQESRPASHPAHAATPQHKAPAKDTRQRPPGP